MTPNANFPKVKIHPSRFSERGRLGGCQTAQGLTIRLSPSDLASQIVGGADSALVAVWIEVTALAGETEEGSKQKSGPSPPKRFRPSLATTIRSNRVATAAPSGDDVFRALMPFPIDFQQSAHFRGSL